MAGKTRCMAEDTAVSFAKHMDNYIKSLEVFKHSIVAAVQAAVLPLQKEISCVKDELAKLKSELASGLKKKMAFTATTIAEFLTKIEQKKCKNTQNISLDECYPL